MSDWPRLLRTDALGAAAAACRIFDDDDEQLDVVRQAEASFIGRALVYLWTQVLDDPQREDIRQVLAEHDLDVDHALIVAENRAWLSVEVGGWNDLLRYLANVDPGADGR